MVIVIATDTMRTTVTTSSMMAAELVDSEAAEVSVVCGCAAEHSISLRDEIATEHSESTVISTPVTMIEGRGREGRGREGKGEFLVYSHTCTFFTYVHVQVHLSGNGGMGESTTNHTGVYTIPGILE